MVLLIFGALVMICFLLAQGVFVLKKGVVAPFMIRQPHSAQLASLGQRLGYAALYMVAGLGLALLLLTTIARRHVDFASVFMWVSDHAAPLFWFCVIAGFGLCSVIWPTMPVAWARRAHPQLSTENQFLLTITRIIGTGLLLISMIILARLQ